MKCPLAFGKLEYYQKKYTLEAVDCLNEECAWWRADIEACALKVLSMEAGYIQDRLSAIFEKLPTHVPKH